jgi:7-cyano-7-deazaguanine reductase
MAAGKDYTKELKALGSKSAASLRPSRKTLETFPNPAPHAAYSVRFNSEEFTSLCPVTGQPDFGSLEIEFTPAELCLESKSLKLYLGSFRTEGAFWEDVMNRIADDLYAVLKPHWLILTGTMNPRGGIGITVNTRRGAEESLLL